MGKTKVVGLKLLKSGQFRIEIKSFSSQTRVYSAMLHSLLAMPLSNKQTEKKKMGRMGQMFPVKAGHGFSKEQFEKWYKYTEEHCFLGI